MINITIVIVATNALPPVRIAAGILYPPRHATMLAPIPANNPKFPDC